MKRFTVSAGMLVLAALSLAAAVWDGSAVAGVAGDFPGDGLYGACNSFPRDTSVTVTNLENGKTVTVIVTNGVDNPGVFIALSPKAAAEIGMRAGAAARIRAVAMTASQAEKSLPPARAGETADPDFNPKVYVEREKAAVKAAEAARSAESPTPEAQKPAVAAVTPPTVVTPAAAATPPTAATPPATAAVPEAVVVPKAVAPELAEVLAKVNEPKKESSPSLPTLTEPVPAEKQKPAIAAVPQSAPATPPAPVTPKPVEPATVPSVPKAAAANIPADILPLPSPSYAFPGSPKTTAVTMDLPSPDLPTIPKAVAPTTHGGYLAQAPEILGGSLLQPRKPATPRVAISEPVPTIAAKPEEQPKPIEKASIDSLTRPATMASSSALSLAEPKLAPEELPDAIMSRAMAPAKAAPIQLLADALPPKATEVARMEFEAISLDRPSYANLVEAAALAEASPVTPSDAYSADRPGKVAGEGMAVELAEAGLPGSPDAVGGEKPSKGVGSTTSASLAEAGLPGSPEAFSGERPGKSAGEATVADLAEAGLPGSPDAMSVEKPAKGEGSLSTASLEDAALPGTPDALSGEKPAKAAGSSETAYLEEATLPGTPDTIADRKTAGEGGLLAELQVPDIPSPSESLAGEKPSTAESGTSLAELAEPGAIEPSSGEAGPTVIADSRGGPGLNLVAELGDPEVPTPSESLIEKPAIMESGQAIAELAEPGARAAGAEGPYAIAGGRPSLSESPSAELATPEVPSPSESIAAERPSALAPGEQTITLEPAAPRPPSIEKPVTPVTPEAPVSPKPAAVASLAGPSGAAVPPTSIPLLKGLAKGSFYVQIGVYGTNDSLQSAIGGFKSTYPMAVESLTTKVGNAAYRLFVGPLTRDESGVVLIRIHSLGYKDAYVRQGS